jgi:hypothetical protein
MNIYVSVHGNVNEITWRNLGVNPQQTGATHLTHAKVPAPGNFDITRAI